MITELTGKIADIYRRYGIKSITMDDLAHELGVSKKTLYLHYKDKKEVVEKVINYLIEQQKCSINQTLASSGTNSIDKLMMMTRVFAEHLKNANPSLTYDLQKFYSSAWHSVVEFKREEIYNHIMDNINTGISEGLYRADLKYEIIARMYVSRLEMYQTELWEPLSKYDPREVFNTLFIYHIRGIANEEGLKYLEQNMDKWLAS